MIVRPASVSTIVLSLFVSAIILFLQGQFAYGQPATTGTNSRAAKNEALKSIPYKQLTPETQTKLASVLEKPSIYRRLPITTIDVDPDMFLFLVRQPEVIVNIWQLMGVTQMSVERTGPFNFLSDDGAGAVSDIELVYGTANKNIYYAEGTYSGPLLRRKLKGRAVMILKTDYQRGADGRPRANNSLDVFLKVENATVSLIAKTLNPIIGPTADHNFVESLKFVQRLNETTEKNGVGVQKMAYRLTNVTEKVRDQFIQTAGTVYERNITRSTQQPNNRLSLTNPQQVLTRGGLYQNPTLDQTYPQINSNPSPMAIRATSFRDYQRGFSK